VKPVIHGELPVAVFKLKDRGVIGSPNFSATEWCIKLEDAPVSTRALIGVSDFEKYNFKNNSLSPNDIVFATTCFSLFFCFRCAIVCVKYW
jgi:hypothetical protein